MNRVELDVEFIDFGVNICLWVPFELGSYLFDIERMDSNIEPTIMDGHNSIIWVLDMENVLKRKGLWQYTKLDIIDTTNEQAKLIIEKKDKFVRVIMTYILSEIHFQTSGINYPHVVWNKIKSFFNKVNEIQVMRIEKYLISLEVHSFERLRTICLALNIHIWNWEDVPRVFQRRIDNSLN